MDGFVDVGVVRIRQITIEKLGDVCIRLGETALIGAVASNS
jgi:hypothetical protein